MSRDSQKSDVVEAEPEPLATEDPSASSRLLRKALFGFGLLMLFRIGLSASLMQDDSKLMLWGSIGGFLLFNITLVAFPIWALHSERFPIFTKTEESKEWSIELQISVASLLGFYLVYALLAVAIWSVVTFPERMSGNNQSVKTDAIRDPLDKGLQRLLPIPENLRDSRLQAVWLLVFFGVNACLIAPLSEELFFRRMVYLAFLERTTPNIAGLASAAMFAAVHLATGYYLLFLFAGGWFLSVLYLNRGRLLACVLAHTMHNIIVCVLICSSVYVKANRPILGMTFKDTPLGPRVIKHDREKDDKLENLTHQILLRINETPVETVAEIKAAFEKCRVDEETELLFRNSNGGQYLVRMQFRLGN